MHVCFANIWLCYHSLLCLLGLHSHLSIHTHTHLYLSVTFIHITLTFTSTLTITSHTHALSGPSSSQTCYSVFILAPSGL